MLKVLPELSYFPLSDLAKTWGCSEEKILHYGIAGQLKICALSAGWELQEGYYIDEGSYIPIKDRQRCSNQEILQLKCHALREILSCGEVANPEFVLESDDISDQGANDDKYECFLSSIVISQNMEDPRGNVIVRKSDLIIRTEDAEAFFSIYTKKNHEVLKNILPPENKIALPIASAVKLQKQKRRHELHDLIGKVIIELGFKDKKVIPHDVWNHLRKQKDRYGCIQDVDDKAIVWISYRGFEQTMKRGTFNNIVSKYNTGEKPYPEN